MSYIAYAELCLVNDLFSWDKEYAAHVKSHGDVPLVNAVHIVAVTQGLTHCAAKAVVQAEIRAHEERFCFLKEQYEATSSPSESILRWLRLLEHSMAGNWVWSLCVPRYFKVDRNPYTDHLAKFGSDAVRVLTPKMEHKHDIQDNHQVLLKDPSRSKYKTIIRFQDCLDPEQRGLTISQKQQQRLMSWPSTPLEIPKLTRQVSVAKNIRKRGGLSAN